MLIVNTASQGPFTLWTGPGKWNYRKYVVDRAGLRVTSFESRTSPDSRDMLALIEQLLAEKPPAARN